MGRRSHCVHADRGRVRRRRRFVGRNDRTRGHHRPRGDHPEGSTAATEGETEGDGVTIRWRTRPDNDAEAAVYAAIGDGIDEANGDTFSLSYEPGNNEGNPYQDQLVTEIGNGTAPDVFWIPGTDIARFQSEGLILDLNELATAEGFDISEFYPEPMYHLTYDPEAGAPGDKLWGLPRDVSTFALYLNNDLIAEAGADDPRALAEAGEWDWAAFEDVITKVTALGGENKGFAMNSWWANYGVFMNAAGGGFFNEDRTACALDTPESIAGLEQIKAIYDGGLAVPFGEDGEPAWKAGTVGAFINGRWATPGARADVAFNWDVVELPQGPGGSTGQLAVLGRLRGERQHRAPGGSMGARQGAHHRRDPGVDQRARSQHPEPQERCRHRCLPRLHPAGEQPGVHQRPRRLAHRRRSALGRQLAEVRRADERCGHRRHQRRAHDRGLPGEDLQRDRRGVQQLIQLSAADPARVRFARSLDRVNHHTT